MRCIVLQELEVHSFIFIEISLKEFNFVWRILPPRLPGCNLLGPRGWPQTSQAALLTSNESGQPSSDPSLRNVWASLLLISANNSELNWYGSLLSPYNLRVAALGLLALSEAEVMVDASGLGFS